MEIIDPKSDLGFKAILVDQPRIFIDVINSMVSLPKPVVDIKYINSELLPEMITIKNSIVDAFCIDSEKRHFIVEMQMGQQSNFIQRTLLNTTKIYSRQIPRNSHYKELQPVYSINLLNHVLDAKTDMWHHEYKLHHHKIHDQYLNDLNLIFFELTKWQKCNNFDINNPLDRWLQFFTNPKFYTMMSIEERKMYDEISEAVDLLNVKKYTLEQLRGYDLFLDNIMIRESDLDDAEMRGKAEGMEKGRLQGKEEAQLEIFLIISDLKKMELTNEQIAEKYQVSQEKVSAIKKLIF